MPSVVGLLEQRELTARRRVDDLREKADRIHAELDVAEREWNEWVIARSRVGEVLGPDDDVVASEDQRHSDGQPVRPEPADAAKPKSVVPMWRAGCPGQRCQWTTSASCRPWWTGTGSGRVR